MTAWESIYNVLNEPAVFGCGLCACGLVAVPGTILIASAFYRWVRPEPEFTFRCAKCGYDLRETSGRCPECGTDVPPPDERYYAPSRDR